MASSSSATRASKTPLASATLPPPPPTQSDAPQSISDILSKANPDLLSLLSRVRTLQDSVLNLRALANPKPGRSYVWAMNHPQRLAYFTGLGYQVTKSKVEVVDGVAVATAGELSTRWLQADGRHISGDLILLDIDSEMAQLIKFEPQMRAAQRIDASPDEFFALAAKEGFRVLEKEG